MEKQDKKDTSDEIEQCFRFKQEEIWTKIGITKGWSQRKHSDYYKKKMRLNQH